MILKVIPHLLLEKTHLNRFSKNYFLFKFTKDFGKNELFDQKKDFGQKIVVLTH